MIAWTKPQATGARYADRVRISEASCTLGTDPLNYRGAWAAPTNYAIGDLVTSGGVLWVATQPSVGVLPAPGSASWSSEVGLDLKNITAVGLHIELPPGGAIGANASLQAWLVNPATGSPNRAPDWDQFLTQGLNDQGLPGFAVPGPVGRLIFVPSNVGGPSNIFLNGVPVPGLLQS